MRQEGKDSPLMISRQAPHCSKPQASLVHLRCRSSRSTCSKDVSGVVQTVSVWPLTANTIGWRFIGGWLQKKGATGERTSVAVRRPALRQYTGRPGGRPRCHAEKPEIRLAFSSHGGRPIGKAIAVHKCVNADLLLQLRDKNYIFMRVKVDGVGFDRSLPLIQEVAFQIENLNATVFSVTDTYSFVAIHAYAVGPREQAGLISPRTPRAEKLARTGVSVHACIAYPSEIYMSPLGAKSR